MRDFLGWTIDHPTENSPFNLSAHLLSALPCEESRSLLVVFDCLGAPVFEYLTLRGIGVVRCDQFIKQMAKLSYSRAKQSRVVLRLALEFAVRHEILPNNPMDQVGLLHREPQSPDALTAVEVNKIRAAIAAWEAGVGHVSGPRPDGQLTSDPSSR